MEHIKEDPTNLLHNVCQVKIPVLFILSHCIDSMKLAKMRNSC